MSIILFCCIICGFLGHPAAAQRRIVGGTKALDQKDYAFQVSVWKKNPVEYFCTGAIISRRFVITCAHCYEDLTGIEADIFIKVGALNLNSKDAVKYEVENILEHEMYSTVTKKFDLGLLLIKGEFKFNQFVKPIELTNEDTPVGAIVSLSGWGLDNAAKTEPIEDLMVIGRTKIDLEECRNSANIQRYRLITNNSFCTATTGHKGTCRGDSGGPVTYKGKLVGIVTGGVDCAKGKPDIHSNIMNHKPWILVKCLYNT